MKHYIVSLDAKPEDRWREIITDNKNAVVAIYHKLQSTHGSWLAKVASNVIGLSSYFGYILHDKELTYISKECGIPFGQLVLLQIMYELSACCTSTVYMMDGIPVHFRTMDWPLLDLKKLTITIDFQSKGVTKYSAVTWAGYIGMMTAVKKGISISMNYRETQGSLWDNISNLAKSYWPSGYLIRYVMENDLDYDEVVKLLTTSKLVAPCYFIVGGSKSDQCIDIVRDRENFQIHKMNNDMLIQTNIDPNASAMCRNILYSRERRELAKNVISKIQKSDTHKMPSIDEIFDAFNVSPIINEETVYMCMMIPQISFLKVMVV